MIPDIDECKQPAVSKCQQNCQNEPGSFTCYCSKGYLLHTNKRNCTGELNDKFWYKCVIAELFVNRKPYPGKVAKWPIS